MSKQLTAGEFASLPPEEAAAYLDAHRPSTEEQLKRVKAKLAMFEATYGMPSHIFTQKWENHELEQEGDFFIWASHYRHYQKLQGINHDFTSKSKAELQHIAACTFPDSIQRRIEELLDKKREDDITENEMIELDQLILEVQLKTVEKAKAMSALKSCKETVS